MAQDRKRSAMQCNELHEEHLCYIVSQGFYLTEDQEYRVLTDHPRFRCDHCGRQAHKDRNLCVPVKMA
jgi:hypothetical protein